MKYMIGIISKGRADVIMKRGLALDQLSTNHTFVIITKGVAISVMTLAYS